MSEAESAKAESKAASPPVHAWRDKPPITSKPMPKPVAYAAEPVSDFPQPPDNSPPLASDPQGVITLLDEKVETWLTEHPGPNAPENKQRALIEGLISQLQYVIERHSVVLDATSEEARAEFATQGIAYVYAGEGVTTAVLAHAAFLDRISAKLSPATRTYFEIMRVAQRIEYAKDEGGLNGDPGDFSATMLNWESLADLCIPAYRDAETHASEAAEKYLRLCWADLNRPACVVTENMRASYERFTIDHSRSRYKDVVAHFAKGAASRGDRMKSAVLDDLVRESLGRSLPLSASETAPKPLFVVNAIKVGPITQSTKAELGVLRSLFADYVVEASRISYDEGDSTGGFDVYKDGQLVLQILPASDGTVSGMTIHTQGVLDAHGIQIGDLIRHIREPNCHWTDGCAPGWTECWSKRTGLAYGVHDYGTQAYSGEPPSAPPSSAAISSIVWGTWNPGATEDI